MRANEGFWRATTPRPTTTARHFTLSGLSKMASRRRRDFSHGLGDDDRLMDELFAMPYPKYDPAVWTLKAIQRKVAVSALPASALRGQRTPGLIRIARDFFTSLPLGPFGVVNAKLFASRLNSCTDELLSKFPRQARRWGVARKSVNLFLRDAFYNQFLAARYNLGRSEAYYELPLDSYTAKALDEFDDEWDLPRWRGLRGLTAADSAVFQSAANDMATEYGCLRVHLDAYIWAQPR